MTRPGVEGLERRDNPSTHLAAAAAATTTKAVAIHGSGNSVVTLSNPTINGQLVTNAINGTSKVLGAFNGQTNSFFGLGLSRSSGNGGLVAADGDTINFTLRGAFEPPESAFRHSPGVVFMTVTGGTGAYANATGHGTETGIGNPIIGLFHFNLHLKVKA
jgi:hypothetical protein